MLRTSSENYSDLWSRDLNQWRRGNTAQIAPVLLQKLTDTFQNRLDKFDHPMKNNGGIKK